MQDEHWEFRDGNRARGPHTRRDYASTATAGPRRVAGGGGSEEVAAARRRWRRRPGGVSGLDLDLGESVRPAKRE